MLLQMACGFLTIWHGDVWRVGWDTEAVMKSSRHPWCSWKDVEFEWIWLKKWPVQPIKCQPILYMLIYSGKRYPSSAEMLYGIWFNVGNHHWLELFLLGESPFWNVVGHCGCLLQWLQGEGQGLRPSWKSHWGITDAHGTLGQILTLIFQRMPLGQREYLPIFDWHPLTTRHITFGHVSNLDEGWWLRVLPQVKQRVVGQNLGVIEDPLYGWGMRFWPKKWMAEGHWHHLRM